MESNQVYDIVVIGAGPAGSIFSTFISSKYKVLMIDRRDYEDKKNSVIKSCGGLLAHEAQSMLGSLGYSIPQNILVSPQVFNVNVLDYDNNLNKQYYKNYLNIDREKFDNYLLSKKASHVKLEKGALVFDQIESKNGMSIIKYKKNGEEVFVKTKLIVAANGADSIFRKKIDKSYNKSEYIAIQRIYEVQNILPYHIALFDKTINDYYSWVIPKENKIVVGTVFKKNENIKNKISKLEERIKSQGIDISHFIKQEGSLIHRPKFNGNFLISDNIAFIGEAAGLISPSSSEGISYALKSGYFLAKLLNEKGIENGIRSYKMRMKKLNWSLNLKYIKSKLMYSPKIRNLIIRLGIFSTKRYFFKNTKLIK